MRTIPLILWLFVALPLWAGEGTLHEVTYEPSSAEGELQLGVVYKLWIPDGDGPLRGVIVHQHGCGVGAAKGGETAAMDLHWQALAEKWNCALLGPAFIVKEDTDCRLWCDPRNGSAARFVQALEDLAGQTEHPELATVPWCLWGHSGGGFWASLMQMQFPERIVAIWFQSGTAYSRWMSGEIEKPEIPASAMQIPMVANPGVKERDHERFKVAWSGCLAMVKDYRSQGAPIAFAPDPLTGHECGDSRYLAIPFFDACLEQRLPEPGRTDLRPVDSENAWLAPHLSTEAFPANTYRGDLSEVSWFPNEKVAKLWEEFVTTGRTSDDTPPEPPYGLTATKGKDGGVNLSWEADADFESGIGGFIILQDGKEVARLPEKPNDRFGRPLFQGMSYHDTPDPNFPSMRILLDEVADSKLQVITINSAGLKSAPSEPIQVK